MKVIQLRRNSFVKFRILFLALMLFVTFCGGYVAMAELYMENAPASFYNCPDYEEYQGKYVTTSAWLETNGGTTSTLYNIDYTLMINGNNFLLWVLGRGSPVMNNLYYENNTVEMNMTGDNGKYSTLELLREGYMRMKVDGSITFGGTVVVEFKKIRSFENFTINDIAGLYVSSTANYFDDSLWNTGDEISGIYNEYLYICDDREAAVYTNNTKTVLLWHVFGRLGYYTDFGYNINRKNDTDIINALVSHASEPLSLSNGQFRTEILIRKPGASPEMQQYGEFTKEFIEVIEMQLKDKDTYSFKVNEKVYEKIDGMDFLQYLDVDIKDILAEYPYLGLLQEKYNDHDLYGSDIYGFSFEVINGKICSVILSGNYEAVVGYKLLDGIMAGFDNKAINLILTSKGWIYNESTKTYECCKNEKDYYILVNQKDIHGFDCIIGGIR